MRLNQNMFSLNIHNNYKNQLSKGKTALDRISSGLKINMAKDNPNKITKNEMMKIQIVSNDAAKKNIQDTTSMIQTFDGAMQEVNNCLSRMKELTNKAANDTLTDGDLDNITVEIEELKKTIDDIANNTSFNGVKLLCDDTKKYETLVGSFSDETVKFEGVDITSRALKLDNIDFSTVDNSSNSILIVDEAINKLSTVRSNYGALQLRLEDSADSVEKRNLTLQSAQSDIGDCDMATEIVDYSTNQILIQASISLMAQSNKFPLDALNILSNLK